MRPRARRALQLVALLLLIAFAGSLWRDGPEANGGSSSGVVEVEIGGQQFAIPRPYIANIARESDGSTILVRLSAQWPGLEPLTGGNQSLRAPNFSGHQVIRIVIGRPIDGYKRLEKAIEVGRLDQPPAVAPFDLKKFEKKHPARGRTARRFVPDDDTYRTPSGNVVVFQCDDLFDWNAQRTMDLEPICVVEYPLRDEVGLHYHFYQKNLQHWRAIDSAVRTLVFSFLQKQET